MHVSCALCGKVVESPGIYVCRRCGIAVCTMCTVSQEISDMIQEELETEDIDLVADVFQVEDDPAAQ